jgi:hypothetical protein
LFRQGPLGNTRLREAARIEGPLVLPQLKRGAKPMTKKEKIARLYRLHEAGKLSRGSLIARLRKLGVPLDEIRFMLDGM